MVKQKKKTMMQYHHTNRDETVYIPKYQPEVLYKYHKNVQYNPPSRKKHNTIYEPNKFNIGINNQRGTNPETFLPYEKQRTRDYIQNKVDYIKSLNHRKNLQPCTWEYGSKMHTAVGIGRALGQQGSYINKDFSNVMKDPARQPGIAQMSVAHTGTEASRSNVYSTKSYVDNQVNSSTTHQLDSNPDLKINAFSKEARRGDRVINNTSNIHRSSHRGFSTNIEDPSIGETTVYKTHGGRQNMQQSRVHFHPKVTVASNAGRLTETVNVNQKSRTTPLHAKQQGSSHKTKPDDANTRLSIQNNPKNYKKSMLDTENSNLSHNVTSHSKQDLDNHSTLNNIVTPTYSYHDEQHTTDASSQKVQNMHRLKLFTQAPKTIGSQVMSEFDNNYNNTHEMQHPMRDITKIWVETQDTFNSRPEIAIDTTHQNDIIYSLDRKVKI